MWRLYRVTWFASVRRVARRLEYSSLCVEVRGSAQHRRASGLTALPQGPSLRSGLSCPGPSSLTRPHPPYSPTRPNLPVVRVICGAFAVPAGASLGRLRAVPSFRCHSFSACRPQRPRIACVHGDAPNPHRAGVGNDRAAPSNRGATAQRNSSPVLQSFGSTALDLAVALVARLARQFSDHTARDGLALAP